MSPNLAQRLTLASSRDPVLGASKVKGHGHKVKKCQNLFCPQRHVITELADVGLPWVWIRSGHSECTLSVPRPYSNSTYVYVRIGPEHSVSNLDSGCDLSFNFSHPRAYACLIYIHTYIKTLLKWWQTAPQLHNTIHVKILRYTAEKDKMTTIM